MTAFGDLVDDCLFEVFKCLTLKEICGVQRVCRRWQLVTSDIIEEAEELELVSSNFESSELIEYKNAFWNPELNDFLKTGIIGENVGRFLQRFSNNNSRDQMVISRIKKLTIVGKLKASGHFEALLNPVGLKRLFDVFAQLKSFLTKHVTWDYNFYKSNSESSLEIIKGLSRNLELIECKPRAESFGLDLLTRFLINSKPKVLSIDYVRKEVLFDFRNLEKIELKLYRIEHLETIVRKNLSLSSVAVEFEDRFDRIFEILAIISILPELATLELKFDLNTYLRDQGFQAFSKSNCFDEALILPKVRKLKLENGALPQKILELILSKFPILSFLELIRFQFGIPREKSLFTEFLERFREKNQLRTLFLDGSFYWKFSSENSFSISWKLRKSLLILKEKLPRLRRFGCGLLDQDDAFWAFCELAKLKPKESFCFKAYGCENSFEPFFRNKPRNVTLIL